MRFRYRLTMQAIADCSHDGRMSSCSSRICTFHNTRAPQHRTLTWNSKTGRSRASAIQMRSQREPRAPCRPLARERSRKILARTSIRHVHTLQPSLWHCVMAAGRRKQPSPQSGTGGAGHESPREAIQKCLGAGTRKPPSSERQPTR